MLDKWGRCYSSWHTVQQQMILEPMHPGLILISSYKDATVCRAPSTELRTGNAIKL